MTTLDPYILDYPAASLGASTLIQADCIEWMGRIPPQSIHAIVTDPPYGIKEYEVEQIEKRASGRGASGR